MQNIANETQKIEVDRTLKHIKSNSYITEYADRTAILVSDTPNSRTITLIYGRDTAEIVEENILKVEGQQAQLTPSQIDTYRLDLASITLPASAAKAMAEGILRSIEDAESRKSDGM